MESPLQPYASHPRLSPCPLFRSHGDNENERMRTLGCLLSLLSLATASMAPQSPKIQADPPPQAKLTVRSNLVMVPAFVTGGDGNVVFGLNAEDFQLTDNGVRQQASDDILSVWAATSPSCRIAPRLSMLAVPEM